LKRTAILGLLAGVALTTVLLVNSGLSSVMDAVASIGWTALVLMALAKIAVILPCAVAWWLLAIGWKRWGMFVWASWVRAAIGELPVTPPLGSEIVGMRILTMAGMDRPAAAACTIADLTVALASQVAFTLTGLFFLFLAAPRSGYLMPGLLICIFATVCLAGFVFVQKAGLFGWLESRLLNWTTAWLAPLRLSVTGLHDRIVATYHRIGPVLAATGLQYTSWLAGSISTWIGLYFMAHPLFWHQIIALDAIVLALRTVAFVAPAGVGVQEGAYILFGQLFGLDAATALALSLLKRASDWLFMAPAIFIWQSQEGSCLSRRVQPAQE